MTVAMAEWLRQQIGNLWVMPAQVQILLATFFISIINSQSSELSLVLFDNFPY